MSVWVEASVRTGCFALVVMVAKVGGGEENGEDLGEALVEDRALLTGLAVSGLLLVGELRLEEDWEYPGATEVDRLVA